RLPHGIDPIQRLTITGETFRPELLGNIELSRFPTGSRNEMPLDVIGSLDAAGYHDVEDALTVRGDGDGVGVVQSGRVVEGERVTRGLRRAQRRNGKEKEHTT